MFFITSKIFHFNAHYSLLAHLSDGLDSLPESAVDQDPGEQQTAGQFPPDVSHLVDPLGDFQHEVTEQRIKVSYKYLKREIKELTGKIRLTAF